MFESQTYEVILKRMLDRLPNDVDKREGSVAYDLLAPKAAELALAYIELDNVLKYGFIDTTYGSFLDSKALELGITRRPAVKAKGTVKFSGRAGTVIPKGTLVYSNNNIRFLTDSDVTIGLNGTITSSITAESAGITGNIAANSINRTSESGITVINELPTYGGADIESDESLMAKYLDTVRKPSVSGNVNDYYRWATSVIGIGDAKVIPIWNGNATVKVVVIDSNKLPVDENRVAEVFNEIEKQRPIGAIVTVESAVGKSIDISVRPILQEGITQTEIINVFSEKVKQYLKDVAFIDPDIKVARIGALLLEIPGVLDYTDLTLNSGFANIPIASNEVAILGAVTLL